MLCREMWNQDQNYLGYAWLRRQGQNNFLSAHVNVGLGMKREQRRNHKNGRNEGLETGEEHLVLLQEKPGLNPCTHRAAHNYL